MWVLHSMCVCAKYVHVRMWVCVCVLSKFRRHCFMVWTCPIMHSLSSLWTYWTVCTFARVGDCWPWVDELKLQPQSVYLSVWKRWVTATSIWWEDRRVAAKVSTSKVWRQGAWPRWTEHGNGPWNAVKNTYVQQIASGATVNLLVWDHLWNSGSAWLCPVVNHSMYSRTSAHGVKFELGIWYRYSFDTSNVLTCTVCVLSTVKILKGVTFLTCIIKDCALAAFMYVHTLHFLTSYNIGEFFALCPVPDSTWCYMQTVHMCQYELKIVWSV